MRWSVVFFSLAALAAPALADKAAPFGPSKQAIELDKQIDWSKARLIAVQDARRYKTLDSFARESFVDMYRADSLPGLSPMASLMEWLFNRPAYADSPVVKIRDKGVRLHFSAHLPDEKRIRIVNTGFLTPRELLDPTVRQRLGELETRAVMVTAMQRVRNAVQVAERLEQRLRIVPPPGTAEEDARWYAPSELLANVPTDFWERLGGAPPEATAQAPVPGVSGELAVDLIVKWSSLRAAWLAGDAPKVQTLIDELADTLPTLAARGVYPSASQRQAEAQYYAMGKFTWGWVIYFIGTIVSVWCLATPWRTPWIVSLVLLGAALALHAYGLSVRWYILGRIPVANMFEAILASAWMCIALALVAELFLRSRVFLFGAHATGFMALMLASYVLPSLTADAGNLTAIMGILDNVMLRIHTVMIIASYALIFLASMIAIVYLFGYYIHSDPGKAAKGGAVVMLAGLALLALSGFLFDPAAGASASGFVKRPNAELWFGLASAAIFLILPFLIRARLPGPELVVVIASGSLCLLAAVGGRTFLIQTGLWTAASAGVWTLVMALCALARRPAARAFAVRVLPAGGGAAVLAGGDEGAAMSMSGGAVAAREARPILAGAAPGDEGRSSLPAWLHQLDWSHLIILNIVFVMLFVGTILGAVWADYSWGRPWGWDPKEVFALNTWIIYAILIHVRFIVKQRGLWTAWLSLAGCAMMAFNWFFVNFFIVGMHSYA